jgi:hypothetical protein
MIASISVITSKLHPKPPCLKIEEIEFAVKDFNFTKFSTGTWYNVYAYKHPLNTHSKCVRTTFLGTKGSTELSHKVLLITNLIDQYGLLTRMYGAAEHKEEVKGFSINYFAVRKALSIDN